MILGELRSPEGAKEPSNVGTLRYNGKRGKKGEDIMTEAYQYTCSACAFQVRSEDSDDVVEFIQKHAKDTHDLSMSKQEVRDGIETLVV